MNFLPPVWAGSPGFYGSTKLEVGMSCAAFLYLPRKKAPVDGHNRNWPHTSPDMQRRRFDPDSHTVLDTVRVEATLVEYRRLLVWAKRFGQRHWAAEHARGLGLQAMHVLARLVMRRTTLRLPCYT